MLEALLRTWPPPMSSAAIERHLNKLGAKDREKEERERLEDWQRNFQEKKCRKKCQILSSNINIYQ